MTCSELAELFFRGFVIVLNFFANFACLCACLCVSAPVRRASRHRQAQTGNAQAGTNFTIKGINKKLFILL